jgi:hypothetical protein
LFEVERVALPSGWGQDVHSLEAWIGCEHFEQVGTIIQVGDAILDIQYINAPKLYPSPASGGDDPCFTWEVATQTVLAQRNHLDLDWELTHKLEDKIAGLLDCLGPATSEDEQGVPGGLIKGSLCCLYKVHWVASAEHLFSFHILNPSVANYYNICETHGGHQITWFSVAGQVAGLNSLHLLGLFH